MRIFILHDDPDTAARQLADNDVNRTLSYCVRRLLWSWEKPRSKDLIVRWLRHSRANYYWMCRFCISLQVRTGLKHYSVLQSLKLSYPPGVPSRGFDHVPIPPTYRKESSDRWIAANRRAYYHKRCKNAKWLTAQQPSWFTRFQVLYSDTSPIGTVLRSLAARFNSANGPKGRTPRRSLRPAGANTVRYHGIVVQYH